MAMFVASVLILSGLGCLMLAVLGAIHPRLTVRFWKVRSRKTAFPFYLVASLVLAAVGGQVYSTTPAAARQRQARADEQAATVEAERVREEAQRRVEQEKRDAITRLEREVLAIPASDATANLAGYQQLLAMDPGNPSYQAKVAHYESLVADGKRQGTAHAGQVPSAKGSRRGPGDLAATGAAEPLAPEEALDRWMAVYADLGMTVTKALGWTYLADRVRARRMRPAEARLELMDLEFSGDTKIAELKRLSAHLPPAARDHAARASEGLEQAVAHAQEALQWADNYFIWEKPGDLRQAMTRTELGVRILGQADDRADAVIASKE